MKELEHFPPLHPGVLRIHFMSQSACVNGWMQISSFSLLLFFLIPTPLHSDASLFE